MAVPSDYERIRMVGQGLHSWEMEGAYPDPETKADMIDYAFGGLSADEVVARALARYGLS